jgi:capsular exopolysaccharide synthesis family protein
MGLKNKTSKNKENIDYKSFMLYLLYYWKLFVITVITAIIIAKFMNGFLEEQYRLSSLISVKEETNPLFSTGTNIAFNWGGASDEIQTIQTILRSRSHNEKVVKETKFFISYLKEGKYRLKDVYGYTPFSINLKTNKPQLYSKIFQIEITGENTFHLSVDFDGLDYCKLVTYDTDSYSDYLVLKNKFSKEYTIDEVISTPFFNFSIKKNNDFKIGEIYFIRFEPFDGTVAKYKQIFVKEVSVGSSIIELSQQGPNKKRIVDYLNSTVKILDKVKQDQKILYAKKTKKWIDHLFKKEKNSLDNIEKELGFYKEENNIFNLSLEGSKTFEEIIEIEKEKKDLLNYIDYLNKLKKYILTHQEYLDGVPVPALIKIQDVKISQEIINLIQKSTIRERLKDVVTENHPSLNILNNEITAVETNLLENISNLKIINNDKIKKLNKRLQKSNSKLKNIPSREQGLLKYKRNFEISEANYNYLKQKSYEAGTAIAANVSDIKIIDKAKDIGNGPHYPQPKFNYIVALMFGFALPLFYVLIRTLFDKKIHTVEEIKKKFSIPILGVVGRNQEDNNLVVFNKPKSVISESFRAIRSNIQFMFKESKNSNSKTIILTSSVGGEGKTMISVNIATVFALSGKKTVLIGLDLRKPKIYDDFDLPNDIGVVNYLINQKSLDEIIISTKIPNFDLILSGPIPPNPSELLINEKANRMIEILKDTYDYIIIDTPPVGLVSDALELFKFSDAVIYVVRQDYSEKGMMKMIEDKYKNKEVTNISYVLNDFSKKKYGYGYGYGYGYNYGYGYGADENDQKNGIISKIIRFLKSNK